MAQTDYDVAISFAGEDRPLAEELAIALQGRAIRVFYDTDEKAELWGKDLYAHLTELYQKRAQFCIILASRHYASKLWATQERKAMQARAFSEDSEYILPVRLDETEIPGLLPTTAYLRWPPETASSIADAVSFKLKHVRETAKGHDLPQFDHSDQAGPVRIQRFQLSLDKIYAEVNCDRSVEYMFGYLCRTAGYLSKAVSQRDAAEKDFIRPISWLFSIASKVGIEVEDAFISRYPILCPSCVQPQCLCL